ncbi:agglutinin 2 [Fusarium beomiforme]|uniref:Agglutinin 2 n=1 Tax=Fusarium beomiforme TaxID=44412 RepID=A0A9P5A6X5_9HYPO|nr:agglutinin 2 [Fusarium beomiforme]
MDPGVAGQLATVVVDLPPTYTTITEYGNIPSGNLTITAALATGSEIGTVVVELPAVGTRHANQECQNEGLEYAIYPNSFYNADAPFYSSFDVVAFHASIQLTITGITDRIGILEVGGSVVGNPDTPPSIYPGSPSQIWQYQAVNYRAYLYTPIIGIYEVIVPFSDEITLVWFGVKALKNWVRANADLEQDYVNGPSYAKTFAIHLEAKMPGRPGDYSSKEEKAKHDVSVKRTYRHFRSLAMRCNGGFQTSRHSKCRSSTRFEFWTQRLIIDEQS